MTNLFELMYGMWDDACQRDNIEYCKRLANGEYAEELAIKEEEKRRNLKNAGVLVG